MCGSRPACWLRQVNPVARRCGTRQPTLKEAYARLLWSAQGLGLLPTTSCSAGHSRLETASQTLSLAAAARSVQQVSAAASSAWVPCGGKLLNLTQVS